MHYLHLIVFALMATAAAAPTPEKRATAIEYALEEKSPAE
jgi:hypothetical protein